MYAAFVQHSSNRNPHLQQLNKEEMNIRKLAVVDGMNTDTALYLTQMHSDHPNRLDVVWPKANMRLDEASEFCLSLAYGQFYDVVGPKVFTDHNAGALLKVYETHLRKIQWPHVALVLARKTGYNLTFAEHQSEIDEQYRAALVHDAHEAKEWKDFLEEAREKAEVMALASEQNEK